MEEDIRSNVGTVISPGRSIQLVDTQLIQKTEGAGRCCIIQTGGTEEYLDGIAAFINSNHISLTVNLDAVGTIRDPVRLTTLGIKGVSNASDAYGLAADSCAAVAGIEVITVVIVENPAGNESTVSVCVVNNRSGSHRQH